ncbi:hypothetical protein HMI55_003004 [Coelomomyces lativittatus]|nr:hypothetical protein HMI56_001810 [Coelomomyces lativittatus]KAJ1516090.1 hypothetical protein HMI55_003004 [Coelomomyces lativittatus]
MNVDDLFKAPPPKRKSDIFSQLPAPKQSKQNSSLSSIHGEDLKGKFAPHKNHSSSDFLADLNKAENTERVGENTQNVEKQTDEEEDSRFYDDGLSKEDRKILDLVDQAETVELATLDTSALKRMVSHLEKTYLRNQESRNKYLNEPTRFMDSELELDTDIRSFSILATTPFLYYEAAQLNLPNLFIQLLSHENSDIRLAVVEVLTELTDEDVLQNDEQEATLLEGIYFFVNSLLALDLLQLLESAYRDEDEEENKWKYYSLLDNLLTSGLQVSQSLFENTQFLKLFLEDLKESKYSTGLGYKVELSAMVVQEFIPSRTFIIKENGVDLLLRALSAYRKRDPPDSDQIEYMENLFDILCACLSEPEGLESFYQEEGIELMLLIIKAQFRARIQAVRVLNYATMPYSEHGTRNAIHFVKQKGLIYLFQLYMRTDQKKLSKKYKAEYQVSADEENIICLLTNILQALKKDENPLLKQVLEQFCEYRHEKLIQLVSYFANYLKKVSPSESSFEEEEQFFLDKLERGFFTLAHLALMIGFLIQENQECKEYLILFLSKIGASQGTILEILTEYSQNAEIKNQLLSTLIESLSK